MKKILKVIVAFQLMILAVLLLKQSLSPIAVQASHEANTPESFIITITSVILTDENNQIKSVFSGAQEVDLAAGDSFKSLVNIKGDVAAGKYKSIEVGFRSTEFKVKGTVVLNGTTYYTKANHANYATGPAELETFSNIHQGGVVKQTFLAPIDISGNISFSLVVDIANVLAYWDGSNTMPTPGLAGPALFIVNIPMAVVYGNPGSREIYNCVASGQQSTSIGRLGLIFDSNSTFIGGMGRALLKDSNTSSIFYTGGFPIDQYTDSGTITIHAGSLNNGQEISWRLTGFKRSSHTGNYTTVYQGVTTNSTYTATRIE